MIDLETSTTITGGIGNLVISKNGDIYDRISIDLVNGLSPLYKATIIPNVVKYGEFSIDGSYSYISPINLKIVHGLETPYLILSLYRRSVSGKPRCPHLHYKKIISCLICLQLGHVL